MEEKKLRIIANMNAPWSTSGYGVQTEMWATRVRAEGYPLALVNFYGLEGGKLLINDIMMYPKIASAWGDDALLYHGKDWKADVSFTLQDIWTMNPDFLRQYNRWIPILPVDHEPIPSGILDRAKLAYRIISYSKFGRDELERQGLYSTYIQHGVDTEMLKPLNKKEEMRKKYGIPTDLFLFGMVAANKDNPSRKSFQEAIDAFAIVHKDHSEAAMFFHALLGQQGGFPIEEYWNFKKLPKDRIYFLQPYDMMFHVGRKEMGEIYNMMDCLVAPSTNEGFGVPIIEAQSCGVPAIVNNWTAMPELIEPERTGLICKVIQTRFSPIGSNIGIPDINDLADKMLQIFKLDRIKMAENCRKLILKEYDMDMVYKTKWSPFLQTLENEIYNS